MRDVYLGKVKKLIPTLNAAFVDIGDKKDAFVHYLDLGLNFKAFDNFVKQINPNKDFKQFFSSMDISHILEKEGKIENVLKPGQPIVVQIVKEPISTKGSRLTGELLYSILPTNYGAIIRTAAEGKNAAVLDAELRLLVRKWEESWPKMATRKMPQLLFKENSKTTTILRDLLNDTFTNIYVNDETVYHEVREYISTILPDHEKIVKLYKGHEPIMDHFDVTRQIKSSFGKVVPMRQGAYLVIEHTEAMHVVDVNSGTRVKTGKDQEQNAFDVNCVAAEEIARQLKLRDMGGIIIVDFIDMDLGEHKNALHKKMQELMASDRAKHNILPLTKFGLMQITRQRVRPATEIETAETCPACGGTGKITSSILIDENIERQLAFYVKEKGVRSFHLTVNPLVEAYLTKGMFSSIVRRWKKKYGVAIVVSASENMAILDFEWAKKDGEKLS